MPRTGWRCAMVTGEAIVPSAAALAEVKAYLRIDGAGEDAAISRFVAAALALCEEFTGQVLLVREFGQTLPAAGAWMRLGRTPVREIAGVAEADGGTALPAAHYAVDIDANGDGWVRTTGAPTTAETLRVAFSAGLAADWAGLPEALAQGVVRLAAHLYGARDGSGGPPAAVTALWRPYRRMRLT